MSVLVKGWTIPKGCADCPTWCKLYLQRREFRHPDCPLIKIPTPHGRLGDLDALVKTLEQNRLCYVSDIDDESFELGIDKAISIVKEVPTVIEAED